MIKQGIIEKLISCLNSNDEDVQCWSILLLHDLSRLGIFNNIFTIFIIYLYIYIYF